MNYWDKLEYNFGIFAKCHNDDIMIKVIKKITKVPIYIRRIVLTKYIGQCRELYQIAFFQWRRSHPSKFIFNLE